MQVEGQQTLKRKEMKGLERARTMAHVDAWLCHVLGIDHLPQPGLPNVLTSGILLCDLANKLHPGSISAIERDVEGKPFKASENVRKFYEVAQRDLGCAADQLPPVQV